MDIKEYQTRATWAFGGYGLGEIIDSYRSVTALLDGYDKLLDRYNSAPIITVIYEDGSEENIDVTDLMEA